ncbi:hypothetical protein L228DRAFT_268772 [Xylona heveae TC161]|uniref:Inclusion body clearance protein IML2 n=1 Tax=Xylona heveae (strain CBS 132557 / TC161) TaxID=1328760 RepID=A0A165GKD7_XYLHT|nr:hypothetical protein L228DRAFT_268772 [Xylona heveae TC161]KZF22297.1 hypothetical protein L228DRAFT_268772 [Xylona heveae TC161]
MMRMGSWLGGKQKPNASTQSLTALDEPEHLEHAMRAVTWIINDDVDKAEAGLNEESSAFHKLGKGVVTFLKATLGFEQDVMREAQERLSDAENAAWHEQRHAQRDPGSYHSSIYPAGTEYALCQSEAQLMSAVVGVLNESLTESIKGFYKLRKAYITLESILAVESGFAKGKTVTTLGNASSASIHSNRTGGSIKSAKSIKNIPKSLVQKGGHSAEQASMASSVQTDETVLNGSVAQTDHASLGSPPPYSHPEDDDVDDFFDADETKEGGATPQDYEGHLEIKDTAAKMEKITIDTQSTNKGPATSSASQLQSPSSIVAQDESSADPDDFSNPIDIFVHSGSNLCFGLLLLLLSIIPPAFGKLLSIIGFRGDREKGVKLLWQATKYNNIHGAMAGIVILGYYNGLVSFCDIIPDTTPEGVGGYPKQRCEDLLAEMRRRYPQSHLWLLEEARMQAANKHLEKAVNLLSQDKKSMLKQVEALEMFEKSLNAMYLHRYELCAESFLKCITLNNWSHGLYYFIAGSCYVELYRQCKSIDEKQAALHAHKAEKYLKTATKHTGKKRFMARQLPFDEYVARKIRKWEQRSLDWKISFIDAIGVSPIEEMNYLWNGYKRMTAAHLEKSEAALAWFTSSENSNYSRESQDELGIASLLEAAILRYKGKNGEARKLLQDNVLFHDRSLFKGHNRDDWVLPTAHYEMAVTYWQDRDGTAADKDRLNECSFWLEKVAHWESFGLDARIGLKVTTAQETLKSMAARSSPSSSPSSS